MATPTNVSERESRQVAEEAREAEWTLPSFGKELFLGSFRLDLIHPQPKLDPEKARKGEAFLEKLRAFLSERVDPLQIERDAKIPEEVIDGLKELGALGMKVPEEYGGLGLSQVHYNQALALVQVWHSSLSALLSAHQSIGVAEPLMLFGSEEQKRKWLPLVARDHVSAFLLTEPDVGSDPARLAATATPTEDGSGYRLDGLKLWATNGAIADIVVVMAKVPKAEGRRGGISAFVLPYDSEGVTVERRNAFMGIRGIENSVTRLTDVFVPAENLIGREGEGLKIALTTLNTGRLALPAICTGVAKWATKAAREFAVERVQWGQPVGKHDAVAQKVAFIAGSAFGLEAMVDVASRLADDKQSDIRIEAAIAKLYGSEIGWRIVDELVQIRGGRGYETAESLQARGEKPVPTEQALRDMRINRIFEGSTEIMHLLIAREAVDQHLQVAGDILDPETDLQAKLRSAVQAGAFYSKWLPGLVVGEGAKPGSFEEFGALATHLRFVERGSRRLARSTFYAMGRWQAALEKRQAFLGRIVDIGAELFAISAAVVYARTIGEEHPERREQAVELADLFCRQARGRVDDLFRALWSNEDDSNHKGAQRVLDGRYTWLEEGVLDPGLKGLLDLLESMGGASLAEGTPEQARARFAALTVGTRQPEHVIPVASVEDVEVDGASAPLRARVYRPEEEAAAGGAVVPALVFLHGGGFVIGDLETHDNQVRRLCRDAACVVVSVDYRLAPEAPWPAGYEDCLAATRWALARFGGAPVAVGGDSAGGNLAALVAQELREALAAQLLIYPATDFRDEDGRYPSRVENAEGYFLTADDMRWFEGHYLAGRDEPGASPLLGSLEGLPPAVVVTAEFDPLRDEGDAYAAALRDAGVEVLHKRFAGMIHGFFDLALVSPDVEAAVAETCRMFRSLLAR